MRKSDKKLEKDIVSALTDACESALKAYEGFQWLTHLVNYRFFPQSFSIICVFDTQESVKKLTETTAVCGFKSHIETRLASKGIVIKDLHKHILLDTEEACDIEHDGHWDKRLEGLHNARYA